jgi:hypothetical protein
VTLLEDVTIAEPADSPDVDEAAHASHGFAGRASGMSPLLAVCGLCGGAGTSTLSYLVARFAVARAGGPVLVGDTGGTAGGLAACAGLQSRRSLRELAAHIDHREPVAGDLYAVDEPASSAGGELRVIASGPRLDDAEADGIEGLGALLAMARSDGAHALTVIDCGTLQTAADRLVLRSASHVAWLLPATAGGVAGAERVLAAVGPGACGRELVVARHDRRERPAALRAMRTLAARRRAPLVLLPHLGDPLRRPKRALGEAQVALQAIVGALSR